MALIDASTPVRGLRFVPQAAWEGSNTLSAVGVRWARALGFTAERGSVAAVPIEGAPDVGEVWVGLGNERPDLALALGLPDRLPPGDYGLVDGLPDDVIHDITLGFALGSYRYARYRNVPPAGARLRTPAGFNVAYPYAIAAADALARDLINTPAQDMGPEALVGAALDLAQRHGGQVDVVEGESRLGAEFPAVQAVGRSGAQPPRVAILRAGPAEGPLVALVGKGVCFDSGGLDLKPSSGMALMKKDMGGAAVALAVASLALDMRLPIQLLVVIPAVENGIGPTAFRPGDVLATRAGLTVEVTNTDAEGRLVLADALSFVGEAQPDVVIDFATLTGAARVALGPDLPALYGSDPDWVKALTDAGSAVGDPLWPMPLWDGYEDELNSRVADLQNASGSGFAGSVTAALFLRRFAPRGCPWLHVDLYAWNPKERPGRPVGASAQSVRAVVECLRRRYAAAASVGLQ